ncbi:hypothetical protein GGR53DRAFT_467945 [Hypoxylon sp. FL1150]|nr:hypothetical protein GGR53DRAFT_467945 [Hypoxylon sp. FL1150]
MVGKVWSDAEEKYFWRHIVERSAKRTGISRANPEVPWDQLAVEMSIAMERQGTSRRTYTQTGLFEHYFQNIEGQRTSPNAVLYVREYLEKLGKENGGEAKSKAKVKGKANTRGSRQRTSSATQKATRGKYSRPVVGAGAAATSTPAVPAAFSPSPSVTASASIKDEAEYSSSPPSTRRVAQAPRPLRTIMPAPYTSRITKSSTPTGSLYNHASIQWRYQTGKLPYPEQSSSSAQALSTPYMDAPTQSAASSFHAPTYPPPPYPANPSSFQPQSETPHASHYAEKNTYYNVGYPTSQQHMPMEPPSYNSYRYQYPTQAIGKHSAMESSYAPRRPQGWEYQMNKYSADQQSSSSASPDIYSAASILTTFATSRPESTQCFPAQAAASTSAYRGHYHHWNQQPSHHHHLPSPHEPYPQTSTGPNSSHFRISPPSQAQTIQDNTTVEEGLFVEEDEQNGDDDYGVDDQGSAKDSTGGQKVLDSIEVASTEDFKTGGTTARGGEEKEAPEYGGCITVQTSCKKASDKKRPLHEWMDYSSENLDYDDVNDGDYIPGMSLS